MNLRLSCSLGLLMLLLALPQCRRAENLAWPAAYEPALAQAQAQKKKVLLNFTGSDWCSYCIKMNRETLSRPEFKTYANQNLVLVEVDFPQGKAQTDDLKAQNRQLQKKFDVRGFPCFVLLDEQGRELGRQEGYLAGGPAAFISKLDGWRK